MDETYIGRVVADELWALRDRIAENIRANGQNATGKTIESMNVQQNPDGATLYGRRYFGALETGRRPYSGGSKRGLSEAILEWLNAKGIHKPGVTDQSLAIAIARSINKKGTQLFRQGGRNDVFSQEIEKATEEITKKFSILMTAEVTSELMKRRKEYNFT